MKWYNREETPKQIGALVLAVFKDNKLIAFQIGRASYHDRFYEVYSDDMLFCYRGVELPKKYTHWAYEDEYWELLQGCLEPPACQK